jgi:hypothetical protein
MSFNNAASLVPILDGANYRLWAVVMQAYIRSTGLWHYMLGKVHRESFPEDDVEYNKLSNAKKAAILANQNEFNREDGMVLGQIMLRLSPMIQQNHQTYVSSFSLWNALKGAYGKSMASTVFKDFKDCLNGCISLNADPNIYFKKSFVAYSRMKAANVAVPPQLQAMIALATLPQKWEMLISVITGDNNLEDLELSDVRTVVITQFQADSVLHGSSKHNANKISVVKRKCGDPNWQNQQGSSNQQQHNNQQQQGHDGQKHKRRKCAGKGKAKQADHSKQHSHIANVASMAPLTTSTIVLPAPSGMQKHTVTCPLPKQHTPGPYKAFNAAIDTAQASGSKPTIQMVKTLEQRITDTYLESPWAKVSHISDVEDSDIEIHPPKGKEDQGDWVFEEADEEASQTGEEGEADPSFEPLSPSAEPLDWGSDLDDGEVCICPSSLPCLVHNLTESHQLLRK